MQMPEKKRKLVGAAVRLILQQGFSGTSVDGVCAEAGVTKGSFFHYFANKEAICEAALDAWAGTWLEILATAGFEKIPDPVDRLDRLFEVMAETYIQPGMFSGCLIGTVAQELAVSNRRMGERTEFLLNGWARRASQMLADAREAHPPVVDFEPDSVADLMLGLVQGSFVIAKARQDPAVILNNIAHLAETQPPRVLVVEDDPVSAKLIQRLFTAQGYPVECASNAQEALDMHSEKSFRIIVSDWMMPGMTGVDLCRAFRTFEGPYVYFILCSSKDQKEDRIEAFEAGVDDFLTKPLDREELRSRLKVARRILAAEDSQQAQKAELEKAARSLSEMNLSLKLASRRFEELFNGLPVACFTFDEDGLIHDWNRFAASAFGIQGFESFLQPVWDVLNRSGDTPWTPDKVRRVFELEDQPQFDWIYHSPTGETRYMACDVICLRSIGGQPVGAVCANLDITERKLAEEQVARQMLQIKSIATQLEAQKDELEEMNQRLNHLAVTDGLTGLWNHRRFQEMLEETVQNHRRRGEPFSLLLMDIDHFKKFNDDFGHQTGDAVLRQFADILRSTSRLGELPARYGGEEFAVILPGCTADEALDVAARFRRSIVGANWEYRSVTSSIGISTSFGDKEGKQIVAEADSALYTSKQAGRDQATHFENQAETKSAA